MSWALVLLAVVIALVALAIYPGEMTHVSLGSSRWLYNRAATGYEQKWRAPSYQTPGFGERIAEFSVVRLKESDQHRVLDLGCGTGGATRLVVAHLPPDTEFVGVDFSPGMLQQFGSWLKSEGEGLSERVSLVETDLLSWSKEDHKEHFGLVLMLEVGEFVADFDLVLARVGELTVAGGGLVLTRPAGFWWLFFPGRRQSRSALSKLLESHGFEQPTFEPWRSRYELVFTRRTGGLL